MEGGGDDQPDRADEFEDAEGHPGFPRQRTKGRDVRAHLVEHEDLHDARRSVQERGEDLQDPQQDVHRVPRRPGHVRGARLGVTGRRALRADRRVVSIARISQALDGGAGFLRLPRDRRRGPPGPAPVATSPNGGRRAARGSRRGSGGAHARGAARLTRAGPAREEGGRLRTTLASGPRGNLDVSPWRTQRSPALARSRS